MSDVWVVRDTEIITRIRCYAGRDEIPSLFLTSGRYTITRETLLTPAHAAVLAAAVAQKTAADAIRTHRCISELPCSHDHAHIAACMETEKAIGALRATTTTEATP